MAEEHHLIGDPEELAALYVAGAMAQEESREFEKHLEAGCRRCAAVVKRFDCVVDELAPNIESVASGDRVRDLLMARIEKIREEDSPQEVSNPQVWKSWPADECAADLFVRRAPDRIWESTGIEGIEVQRLFNDSRENRMTALVRMAPGTSYPAHVHNGPEECYVLQGDLRVDDQVLCAGDYERRAPTSRHGIQSTKDGCLLLIVSSLSDEFI